MNRRGFLHAFLAGAMLASGRVGFGQTKLATECASFLTLHDIQRMQEQLNGHRTAAMRQTYYLFVHPKNADAARKLVACSGIEVVAT